MGVTVMEFETAMRAAAALGRCVAGFDHRHRHRAEQNLSSSFPHLGKKQISGLAVGSFEHLAQLVVEMCFMPRMMTADNWSKRTTLSGVSQAIDVLNSNRGAILVTGHLGNWEILGHLLTVLGYRIEAVARPMDNPWINDWLIGVRQRRGLRIITKWNASDRLLEVLGGGGTLGFIADQNAGKKGLFVPFFGRLASTYKSIGLLAITQNVPIICGYARRVPPGYRYEFGVVDVIEPIQWAGVEDPLYYVTARYMHAIELMIHRCPEQYLWMHKRWKSRPRFETLGQPMPGTLKDKLQALPWIAPEMMDRLTELH